jgi:hypothetical protein
MAGLREGSISESSTRICALHAPYSNRQGFALKCYTKNSNGRTRCDDLLNPIRIS